MANTEKRPLVAVVAKIKAVADEWATRKDCEPGSALHALYVQVLRKLLAESRKCDK